MLAIPGQPFDSQEHYFEIKWDGIRAIAYKDGGDFRLETRSLKPALPRFPELAAVAGTIRARRAVLDGEIVTLGEDGRPDFERVRARSAQSSPAAIRRAAREHPALYIAFDCLFHDDEELFAAPLTERVERLWEACVPGGPLVLSKGVVGPGITFFEQAASRGLEGVVAKRLTSPYLPGERSPHWIKVRAVKSADCVVGGFVPKGELFVKSLLLGLYDGARLAYVGRVAAAVPAEANRSLREVLEHLRSTAPPFSPVPSEAAGGAVWVRPNLVASVEYLERTRAGHLRHPRFKGLRSDKEPESCLLTTELTPLPAAGGTARG